MKQFKSNSTNFQSETNTEWLVLPSPVLPGRFSDSKEKNMFTSRDSAFPQ